MTIQDKVNLLCSHSQRDVSSFVELASSFFMNSLPIKVARNFYVAKEIPENGIKCSIKKDAVVRGKRPCREISFFMVESAKDSESANYATEIDPVYYYKDNKIHVLPVPTNNQKAYVNTIPEIKVVATEESIEYLTEDVEPIVLIYAAFLLLVKESSNIRESSNEIIDRVRDRALSFQNEIKELPSKIEHDISFEYPVVPDVSVEFELINSIIDVVDLSYTNEVLDLDIDIPDLSVSYTGVLPVFEMPSIQEPSIDLTKAEEAVDNAFRFIGDADIDKGEVPKGAYWLDDEDPEMVQSAVQLASTEIQRANSVINAQLGQVNIYKESINASYTAFKSNLDAFLAEVNFKASEIDTKSKAFQTELQAKISVINAKIQKVQNEIAIGKYGLDSEIAKKQHELNVAKTNIEQQVSSIQMKLTAYQAEVQSISQRISSMLQEYSIRVNENIQMAQLTISNTQMMLSDINHMSTAMQGSLSLYGQLLGEATAMYQRYQVEYTNYLASLGYDTKTGN